MTFTDNPKNSTSFSGATKHSASPSNKPKSTSSFSNDTKSTDVFANDPKSRIGTFGDLRIDQLADYTFQSVVLIDGTTIENVTFDTLVYILWRNQQKN